MTRTGLSLRFVVPDETLAFAVSEWVESNRALLGARGVTVLLDGPHDPAGMEPVYLLRLDSPRAEAEATLFRGGTVLLATLEKSSNTVEQSYVDASCKDDVSDALSRLAESV